MHRAEGESVKSVEYQKEPLKVNKDYFEAENAQIEATDVQIKDYVRRLWGKNADTMIKIIQCESNFNPKAINWNDAKITGMPSQGVAQINAPYNERLFDWKYNLDVAFEMYQRRSFQPWSCFTKKLI